MTAFIERNPRQGVELYTPGDVNWPHKPQQRDSLPVRIIWACVGVTVFLGIATFVLRGAATFAEFFGRVGA